MRDVAGVDSSIFFSWAQHFIAGTEYTRKAVQNVLLASEGFADHCQLKTLQLLKERGHW